MSRHDAKIRPFTDDERQKFAKAAREQLETRCKKIKTRFLSQYLARLCQVYLCYEATLQAKDEQIEALVDGILDIPEWMSGRNSHICPFCKGLYDEHEAGCLRKLAISIRETGQ